MPLTFIDLPSELRVMILELCELDWRRNFFGFHMLGLIVALRPQSICYHEAFDIFYQRSRYQLDSYTSFSGASKHRNPMAANALSTIQNLAISTTENYMKTGFARYFAMLRHNERTLLDPDTVISLFRGSNVQDFKLTFRVVEKRLDTKALLHSFPRWFYAFCKLKKLTVEVVYGIWAHKHIMQFIRIGNDKAMFSTSQKVWNPRLCQVAFNQWQGSVVWEWTASEGEVMDWSKDSSNKSGNNVFRNTLRFLRKD